MELKSTDNGFVFYLNAEFFFLLEKEYMLIVGKFRTAKLINTHKSFHEKQ